MSTYGYLYTWETAHLCPNGWHLPSDEEWTQLERYLGGSDIAGEKLKSATKWNGTNTSGFSALPAGASYDGSFDDMGKYAYFWLVTEEDATSAWGKYLNMDNFLGWLVVSKTYGHSVRCLKD